MKNYILIVIHYYGKIINKFGINSEFNEIIFLYFK